MHIGKIVLLMLSAAVLIFSIVIAILWSMTSILALPYEQAVSLLGAIGTWVAGLGALAAVGVALWLAHRHEQVRMKFVVDLYGAVYGDARPAEYCVSFQVTNLGVLPITVKTIKWFVGTGRNEKWVIPIIPASPFSRLHPFPKKLEYGEGVDFRVPVEVKKIQIWMRNLADGLGVTKRNIKTLRARIYTTTDHVEIVKPSKDFMKELAEAMNSEHPSSAE